jgi:hypothetical protein
LLSCLSVLVASCSSSLLVLLLKRLSFNSRPLITPREPVCKNRRSKLG